MKNFSGHTIQLGGLAGFAIWVFVVLPFLYGSPLADKASNEFWLGVAITIAGLLMILPAVAFAASSPWNGDGSLIRPAVASDGPRDKMKTKDWITGILAFLALIVSALTFYFSIIRQADDLRVVSSSPPFVNVDAQGKLGISGRQEVTFINSGNRDAAVTGVTLVIFKLTGPPSADSTCKEGREIASLVYEVEPSILIKPGEIMVKKLDRTLFPDVWATDATDNNLKHFLLGNSIFTKGDVAFTCLRLSVTTPDMITDHALVPKHYITISDIPLTGPNAGAVNFVADSNKPYLTVQTTHTVFTH